MKIFNDKLYHDCYEHLKILHPILQAEIKVFQIKNEKIS